MADATNTNESSGSPGAAIPKTFDPKAHYEVEFLKVIDLGDMKMRPAHSYPFIGGDLLATIDRSAIKSAKLVEYSN
jgi:hypothetical protein